MVFDKPAFGEYAFFLPSLSIVPTMMVSYFYCFSFFSMRTDRVHYADLNVEWAVHSKTSKWCSNCHHKHKCCFCVCFFFSFFSHFVPKCIWNLSILALLSVTRFRFADSKRVLFFCIEPKKHHLNYGQCMPFIFIEWKSFVKRDIESSKSHWMFTFYGKIDWNRIYFFKKN